MQIFLGGLPVPANIFMEKFLCKYLYANFFLGGLPVPAKEPIQTLIWPFKEPILTLNWDGDQAMQCNSLESDPVKESLVADAPVTAIWIIDPAFKHSSIRCLVPLHSHNCFGCHTTSIMILFGFIQKTSPPQSSVHCWIVRGSSTRPARWRCPHHAFYPPQTLPRICRSACHSFNIFSVHLQLPGISRVAWGPWGKPAWKPPVYTCNHVDLLLLLLLEWMRYSNGLVFQWFVSSPFRKPKHTFPGPHMFPGRSQNHLHSHSKYLFLW